MIRASLQACLFASIFSASAFGQAPSVQLTIKEKSGFLGMGGPRVVSIDLSTQNRDATLTSENVNGGPYYYFLVKPAADWALDADIVKEDLSKLIIVQNEQKFAIMWKGEIVAGTPATILLGYPRSVNLHQPFQFQIAVGDKVYQADVTIPQQYWPGYTFTTMNFQAATEAVSTKQARAAIAATEKIVSNSALQIFPHFERARSLRTQAFGMFLGDVQMSFQATVVDTGELKGKIARVEGFRPLYQFVVDSLPRAAWNIGSLDPAVAPIVEQARAGVTNVHLVRDSLQRVLDDKNVRWIIEGSAVGKNGFLYQYMIETLAWAFSSANFEDTTATDLKLTIPDEFRTRLERYALVESYETFLRLSIERMQTNLPMFPVEFLPNLRKDTSSFSQPFFSMLKAVNDYYYGNITAARDEAFRVLMTCTEPDLNARFDLVRVLIDIRRGQAPGEVLRILEDARQHEQKGDADGALERYRQATVIAPNFAYAFFAIGQFYVRTGDPIRAINFFQRAYQIDSLYNSAYRESYNMYLKQGNYKPIVDVLLYAIQHGNDTWEVNSNLGTAFLGDNDPARAIQHFERALALNGKSYKTNIQLGLAHQAVKNYQKAREYFNNAIGLDPTRQDAVDYLTRLNEMQRNEK
ncbi:MAG: hypothetical protein A2X67_14035 [Ignavibacteria bacterium GWA2_55_11]|nr:MAG: hypothetical protein A2X67_14035 [Ignavibacteria bacterium GWA2_55_11]OGU43327.1 MAG: hypothetical protein A2X68_04660 [Ignavibacteria bacterium GWC2_56_12]OGU63167.1 MAG: hypothetical protein A3C56_06565 [Ignavibacteria bacterium RIFCSPHIGHO2_02_FULL_56_12]OGU70597.1 MAG: hypothetical protein A3G43_06805 [Ignavibacteria bacterium RIFCSPLOWO2_12_FULL_56_21]OGU73022.1 MAG: hypothetical protein A3H45_13180 [Ignavibacteria bacterium RIFCSPLOWO2_02_FULL_55_14]